MIPLKICKFLYENSIQMTVGRNCYEKRLIRNTKTIIDQGIYHERERKVATRISCNYVRIKSKQKALKLENSRIWPFLCISSITSDWKKVLNETLEFFCAVSIFIRRVYSSQLTR